MKNSTLLAAFVAAIGTTTFASITIDGSLDAMYGDPLSVQDTQTQFGDSNLGAIDYANGSELDNAYGLVDGDYLYLFFGGNLESNFNKLEVFIDFTAGGQNKLRGDNPDVDFNGLNRMGDDGTGNGLAFDKGFEADYYVTTTCGGGPFATYANTSQVLTDGGGTGEYIGSGGSGTSILNGSNGTLIGFDNSNIAGVAGGTKLGSGFGVSTGIEIALPLALLAGYDGGDLKVSAFINGGGHDFLSNQILGPIGGGVNFGEPRLVDFKVVPGEQYFIVPGGGGGGGCAGDVNGDNVVDASDLAVVLGGWGTPDVDLNNDGTTDATDLAIVLGAWGACPYAETS
jgi:hypothetical protein